ncbi:hypothetical protein [Flammeovirga sp. SJP92]|uniref:hypothetical protein n=1 Tax=Flammeovirga sp. SJP92 TaxID=1775430 RepID=UPI0007886468|nr:hypothetical protein [Flammeovirga sp. SJP92]KXX66878.1 hypothetical protein AVL50_30580 [Flammeovirga sp. SJP92]
MKNTDDIDFLLTLHPHGWSTCWIYINDKKVELTISHIFTDPYYDFMKSLSQLMDKQKETTFFWYGEPGGERIIIKRIQDRQHMIHVKVDGFYEPYGEKIKDFETTIEFEIKEKQLIILAYYQLKKISFLLKEESFSKNREKDFPFKDFVKFEDKVKGYFELEKGH